MSGSTGRRKSPSNRHKQVRYAARKIAQAGGVTIPNRVYVERDVHIKLYPSPVWLLGGLFPVNSWPVRVSTLRNTRATLRGVVRGLKALIKKEVARGSR